MVAGDVAGVGAVWDLVRDETPFESQASFSPFFVFVGVNVRRQFFYVHLVVPIEHILAVVIALLQVVSLSLLVLFLNVEFVIAEVARDDVLQLVPLPELQRVEVYVGLQDGGTPVVLSHELNELVQHALHVVVGLVSN